MAPRRSKSMGIKGIGIKRYQASSPGGISQGSTAGVLACGVCGLVPCGLRMRGLHGSVGSTPYVGTADPFWQDRSVWARRIRFGRTDPCGHGGSVCRRIRVPYVG